MTARPEIKTLQKQILKDEEQSPCQAVQRKLSLRRVPPPPPSSRPPRCPPASPAPCSSQGPRRRVSPRSARTSSSAASERAAASISGPRRRCPSLSITGSRACNARNSKSSVPAQRIQSQATGKTTTREVPLGLTQVERPPMEEGTMSTLQIWQALQGRSHSLDWLASKTTSEKGTSDTNACIALSF